MFEGEKQNTPERGRKAAKKCGATGMLGYDAHLDGFPPSLFMYRFGTGGTPWTVVIDKNGIVQVNSVTPEADELAETIESLRGSKKVD